MVVRGKKHRRRFSRMDSGSGKSSQNILRMNTNQELIRIRAFRVDSRPPTTIR
jgi:hypothetical protein